MINLLEFSFTLDSMLKDFKFEKLLFMKFKEIIDKIYNYLCFFKMLKKVLENFSKSKSDSSSKQ
jgi:hypothetical protein